MRYILLILIALLCTGCARMTIHRDDSGRINEIRTWGTIDATAIDGDSTAKANTNITMFREIITVAK